MIQMEKTFFHNQVGAETPAAMQNPLLLSYAVGETEGWGQDTIHYFLPRILAAWLTSPGGLNIIFKILNIIQRPQHCFLAKLWHKNDETARLTSPREFQ